MREIHSTGIKVTQETCKRYIFYFNMDPIFYELVVVVV